MDAFIARQPILDRRRSVRGYELLFRSGLVGGYDHDDPDRATSSVIAGSLFLPRLDTLTSGRTAFINIPRGLLVHESVTLLPAATTVLEILESVEPDDEVLAACRSLRGRGYRLALDDFKLAPRWLEMLSLVDIVKVDVLATTPGERTALARRLLPAGVTLLAEKVESQAMFEETMRLGFGLFQGYFFARPTIVGGRDISGSRLNHLQVLREIHKPDLDIDALGEIIEREVGLAYKLLRYVNASFFGWRGSVDSIHHALRLLGEIETKKWASVMALAGMASEKPDELVVQTLLRARFCELLAPAAGLGSRAPDLFLMGLFSLLDAILDCPLEEILGRIPINDEVKEALLGQPGPLRDVFDLVVAYETGDWRAVEASAVPLDLDMGTLPSLYADAVGWGHWGAESTDWAKAA